MSNRILSAVLLLVFTFATSACAPAGNKTAIGAGTGAVLGAGLGAIIGSATGDAGPGIAIGAGAGALAGGALGNALDANDGELAAQREENERQRALIEENRRLIDELRRKGADVRPSERGVVINLPDILFDFDRANLTREAERTVGEIGNVLSTVQGRVIAVEGHTDSVGTFSYNQKLSERRAKSVARQLQREGIPKRQMRVIGYGEGSPIATNNSEIGRSRNRRVEVIVEN